MPSIKTLALTLVVSLGASAPAFADQPGADWMPEAQVKQKLMAAGYSSITEFEADDGHWEGEGMKNGKKMQFHADAKTGAILTEKLDD